MKLDLTGWVAPPGGYKNKKENKRKRLHQRGKAQSTKGDRYISSNKYSKGVLFWFFFLAHLCGPFLSFFFPKQISSFHVIGWSGFIRRRRSRPEKMPQSLFVFFSFFEIFLNPNILKLNIFFIITLKITSTHHAH